MDKMNLKTKLFRTGMTFFAFWPSTSFSQEKVAYKPPLEMMCTVQNEKALHCVYDDGTTRKILNDQDLIAFINQANKGAYVTVKSRKGFERVFFIDPNGAEFKTFYRVQKTPGISMREVGQAKYAIFAAIENKAITISKTLDSGGTLPLVNADPANAYYQYKDQLKTLKKEKDDLDLSYQKLKESSSEKNLEAALQEKQYFSHYLSDLVKLLGETGSCAEEFQLKPGADGSVNLDHLNDLARFSRRNVTRRKRLRLSQGTTSVPIRNTTARLLQPANPSIAKRLMIRARLWSPVEMPWIVPSALAWLYVKKTKGKKKKPPFLVRLP